MFMFPLVKQRTVNATAGPAVPFTENFKFPESKSITFDADSFETWCNDALPIIKGMATCSSHHQAHDKGLTVGSKVFYVRECDSALEIYRGRAVRYAMFSRPVKIPILADRWMDPWMSLTPNEVFSLRGQIKRARGNVAVAGLGLGWTARKILQRPQVERLTVYEIDENVIETFGKSLIETFGDRIQIVQADAYTAPWENHDVALWDIWQDMSGAAHDGKFKTIRRKMDRLGKVCFGWGIGANGG